MKSMRTAIAFLLLALGCAAGSASAATISNTYIYYDPGYWSAIPAQFDPSLGDLGAVKIEVASKYDLAVDVYGYCEFECGFPDVYFSYDNHISRQFIFGSSVLPLSYNAAGIIHVVSEHWNSITMHADPSSINVYGSGLDYFVGNGTFLPRYRDNFSFSANLSAPDYFYGYWSWSDSAYYDTLKITYFYTPAGAVPDAATWLLMVVGFAGVGLVLRRRPAGRSGAAMIGR